MTFPVPVANVYILRNLITSKSTLLVEVASCQLSSKLIVHGKVEAVGLLQLLLSLYFQDFLELVQVLCQVCLRLFQLLLVCTLLHHVVRKTHVDLLCGEHGMLPECQFPQPNALLIGILGLFSLLHLLVHVTALFVNSTDQIWVVDLLEDGESAIQIVVCLALLEEFPVHVTMNAVNYPVMPAFFVLLIEVYDIQSLLKIFFCLL